MMRRRSGALLTITAALAAGTVHAQATSVAPPPPYGVIGKMLAKPGLRDALITVLIDGSNAMPGCLSYIVAKDAREPDAIWITELWSNRAAHDDSLKLDQVKAAIAKGRPLIAATSDSHETVPVGGQVLGGK